MKFEVNNRSEGGRNEAIFPESKVRQREVGKSDKDPLTLLLSRVTSSRLTSSRPPMSSGVSHSHSSPALVLVNVWGQ